jgi:hypothetical protein
MKNLSILLLVILFSSCMTQRKVESWLDDHPLVESKRCHEMYPCVTTGQQIEVRIDSSAFIRTRDSALSVIAGLSSIIGSYPTLMVDTTLRVYPGAPALNYNYADVKPMIAELRRLVLNMPSVNMDSIVKIKIKDSAEVVMWKETARQYRDSANFFKGGLVTAENEAAAFKRKYRSLLAGIIALIVFLLFVLIMAARAKGMTFGFAKILQKFQR